MSIQSEIDRISQNVSDSLDAVAAKGATVPTGSTSDDLPSLIASIPTSGAVESVNGQTGVVTLTASDVGALPSNTAIPSAAIDIGALPSILDSNYYGTTLPTAGTVGRIFFLKTQ